MTNICVRVGDLPNNIIKPSKEWFDFIYGHLVAVVETGSWFLIKSEIDYQQTLKDHLSHGCRIIEPDGGYWTLGENMDILLIFDKAIAIQTPVFLGDLYELWNTNFK